MKHHKLNKILKKNLKKDHKAIIYKSITCISLLIDNSIIKYILNKEDYKEVLIYEIVFFQNTISLVLMISIFKNIKEYKIKNIKYNIIRGIISSSCILFWYISISKIPMINLMSSIIIIPTLTLLLSTIVLKEEILNKRIISILLMIIGITLINIQTALEYKSEIKSSIIISLIFSILSSTTKIISKKLIDLKESIFVLMLFSYISSMIINFSFTLISGWKSLNFQLIIMIIFISIINFVINYTYLKSYEMSDINYILPYGISFKILITSLICLIIFNEYNLTYLSLIGNIFLLLSIIRTIV